MKLIAGIFSLVLVGFFGNPATASSSNIHKCTEIVSEVYFVYGRVSFSKRDAAQNAIMHLLDYCIKKGPDFIKKPTSLYMTKFGQEMKKATNDQQEVLSDLLDEVAVLPGISWLPSTHNFTLEPEGLDLVAKASMAKIATSLSARERTVLGLYAAGWEGARIAETLGMEADNVYQVKKRALDRIENLNLGGGETGGTDSTITSILMLGGLAFLLWCGWNLLPENVGKFSWSSDIEWARTYEEAQAATQKAHAPARQTQAAKKKEVVVYQTAR